MLSQTSVVVHDPDGLDLATRADAALWALQHTRAALEGRVPSEPGHILAPVPIPILAPDVAVAYLYVTQWTSLEEGAALAEQYAAHFDQPGVETYVTGLAPAQVQQVHYLTSRLTLFELATLALICVVVALVFRSLVAPLVVLALNALSVGSALGLAVVAFQVLGDQPGLTFYVPFVAAVLLLALGADYYVFAVGAIWTAAAHRPLRQAIAFALPASNRAISAAGIILASTFAMVAVIPLGAFRQLAFIMAVGLLLDTFVVRPVLTPAVLTLLGRTAGWPGGRIRTATPTPPAESA